MPLGVNAPWIFNKKLLSSYLSKTRTFINNEKIATKLSAYLPVYTKRQRQRCDHSTMMLAILFSLKSMETLENELQPHYGALSQSWHLL